MKRKFFYPFFLILFFVFFTTFSLAQKKELILPSPDNELAPNFFGQNHYYTVTFRGNGEAVVNLKVILSNLGEKPLATVSLRVPLVEPKDILVYQVIREKQCIIWAQYPTKCQQYQEPDYYQPWWEKQKYQKAKYEMRADTIVISLPIPIEKEKSGSFLVYYRALGYTKKKLWGVFDFVFETAKVEDRIQNLQVGITTDSDLYLKGAKGKVSYRLEEEMGTLKMAPAAGEFTNTQFDSFYQQIGQGTIVKTASNLQPLDSYTIKGSYADSLFKLYGKEIFIGGAAALLLFFIFMATAKFVLDKMKKPVSQEKNDIFVWVLVTGGLSFVSAFLILGYSLFVFWLTQYFSSYYYQSTPLFFVLILFISVGIYLILVFTPVILIAIKKGLVWAIATFFLTVFWLIFFAIISLFIFFFSQKQPLPIPIYPQPVMMEKSVEGGASKK